jgi:hypothetical protein
MILVSSVGFGAAQSIDRFQKKQALSPILRPKAELPSAAGDCRPDRRDRSISLDTHDSCKINVLGAHKLVTSSKSLATLHFIRRGRDELTLTLFPKNGIAV